MAACGTGMATVDHCRCHTCIAEIVVRHPDEVIPAEASVMKAEPIMR